MTHPKLLVPLRIPELGPFLGKLVTGTGGDVRGLPIDAVRQRLATRVMTSAGEARRLAGRDERSAAVAAVGRSVWLAAWEEAVAGVAHVLVERVTERLVRETEAVRMPRARMRRLMLGPGDERALAARLGSVGASLIPALDAIEERGARALTATALEHEGVEQWLDALKTAARRLEASWLSLEEAIRSELAWCDQVADEIAGWRKPLWPVAVVGGVLMVAAVWLGLVLGGYLASPGWLTHVWEAVGLP